MYWGGFMFHLLMTLDCESHPHEISHRWIGLSLERSKVTHGGCLQMGPKGLRYGTHTLVKGGFGIHLLGAIAW